MRSGYAEYGSGVYGRMREKRNTFLWYVASSLPHLKVKRHHATKLMMLHLGLWKTYNTKRGVKVAQQIAPPGNHAHNCSPTNKYTLTRLSTHTHTHTHTNYNNKNAHARTHARTLTHSDSDMSYFPGMSICKSSSIGAGCCCSSH